MKIENFIEFINEGKREEAKMNELLEIMKKRKLTDDENELLISLSRGGKLPEESSSKLRLHKTGGYLYDDKGNILTEDEPVDQPGKEFVTIKGKSRPLDKLESEDIIEARVYRNKNNEERFIYSYVTLETENDTTNEWLIYRTDGGKKFGMLLDMNQDRLNYYKHVVPESLWKELDYKFDYGMILDQDLYEDFINFVELYIKNKNGRNDEILNRLHSRFCALL